MGLGLAFELGFGFGFGLGFGIEFGFGFGFGLGLGCSRACRAWELAFGGFARGVSLEATRVAGDFAAGVYNNQGGKHMPFGKNERLGVFQPT